MSPRPRLPAAPYSFAGVRSSSKGMNSVGCIPHPFGGDSGRIGPRAARSEGRGRSKMGNASLVLTVIGADRPGLVEALSKTIADHGASWLESRIAHRAGHFVGLLRVR